MKSRIIHVLVCCFVFAASGCSTQANVPYEEASGYFVLNTIADGATITYKITEKEKFGQLFGMAATMGSLPTDIDFSKEYVATVILPSTDRATTVSVDSFSADGRQAELVYTVNTGARQSYTIRPFLLLVLSKGDDYDIAFKEVRIGDAIAVMQDDIGEKYVELKVVDGTASATVSKSETEKIMFGFDPGDYTHLSGTLTSADSEANIRFVQIFMPDGTADGPFGREIDYDLGQRGEYRFSVGENMMAGDPWGGEFTVEIELSK